MSQEEQDNSSFPSQDTQSTPSLDNHHDDPSQSLKKKKKRKKRKRLLTFEEMMARPARKQIESPDAFEQPHVGLYNIWYGRMTDYSTAEERREERLAGTRYRLNIQTDTGFTKAKPGAYHCIYWAMGRCFRGPECVFLHRPPIQQDEDESDHMTDIFGRDRHATDREDMGGVGNFNRAGKTLFIKGMRPNPDNDQILYKHFIPFGEIVYLKVIEDKNIAFIQYKWRCSAELAKEAMNDQALDNDEVCFSSKLST
eukprot:TRINITY_DN229_c0_g1_i1.p1 TRINITY_DN229_c0_g1~~TRINITY_DN229_c0_g1_i1.p1  ORF type:complete len:254 (-),score=48.81 TRINITY_DN229_c0_g1_i1:540-1301(-)